MVNTKLKCERFVLRVLRWFRIEVNSDGHLFQKLPPLNCILKEAIDKFGMF